MTVTVNYDNGRVGMEFVRNLAKTHGAELIFKEEDDEATFNDANRALVDALMDELFDGELIFDVNVERREE